MSDSTFSNDGVKNSNVIIAFLSREIFGMPMAVMVGLLCALLVGSAIAVLGTPR